MIDEAKRQTYLQTMGVTQWQLRSAESVEINEEIVQPQTIQSKQSTHEPVEIETDQVTTNSDEKFIVKGLRSLNHGSKNGLLVVLSEQRKELSPESRMLMSKMLKAIHFLPAETGFAVIGDDDQSASDSFTLDSVKAILVLGNEAGRQLVRIAGARNVPGSNLFSLGQCEIVITLHPDELINSVENKQQAWNDLKQLVQIFKS